MTPCSQPTETDPATGQTAFAQDFGHNLLIATVVGLWMLFTGGPIDGGGHERWLSGNGLFWLAWPIGGILCGVATCIIQIFRSFHDRDR